MSRSPRRWPILDIILPWITLGILMASTYVMLFRTPYLGFDFNPSNGEIVELYVQVPDENNLAVGDRLIQVGQRLWDTYRENPYLPLVDNLQPGDEITLTIQQGDREKIISWALPGPTYLELLNRLMNIWWVGYIFWCIGTVSVLFVRPRDTRRMLFIGFNYLTAIWLVVGSWSRWQEWGGAVFFASVLWLCVPVYLHLHWMFPKPLWQMPRWLIWGVYGISFFLAIAEWFLLLPRGMYYFGFLLATGGSVVLLVLHYLTQPEFRRDIGLLFVACIVAILPSIVLSIVQLFSVVPRIGGGSLLALPILPVAYFYAIYRRRFGGIEARANRIISAYVFFILLGIIVVLTSLMLSWLFSFDYPTSSGLIIALFSSILTAFGYPWFIRWFEFYLLGIKLSSERLVESYANRITVSLTEKSLVQLVRDELLPGLMIRQSTLLRVERGNELRVIYTDNVEDNQLPGYSEALILIEAGNRYLHPLANEYSSWVRLSLPLRVDGKVRGLWLLGRRDPDDYYAPGEIDVLKIIANQTAIALANIEQAERLRALYQSNIERHEQERTNLARDLHDDVLNQFANLFMKMEQKTPPGFEENYQAVTSHLRKLISGLRPAMLTYGLAPALEELTDELVARIETDTDLQVDVIFSGTRYGSEVEAHLYRIVQEACQNALRHAQANSIRVYGNCGTDSVQLAIEDNGIGFPKAEQPDLMQLVAENHYGITGMFERAELIGAELRINTAPGEGTKVILIWHPEQAK